MQTVLYKRGDMVGQAFGCLALAVGSVWMAANFHGTFKLLGVFLAVTLPFLAVALFARAAGGGRLHCFAIRRTVPQYQDIVAQGERTLEAGYGHSPRNAAANVDVRPHQAGHWILPRRDAGERRVGKEQVSIGRTAA